MLLKSLVARETLLGVALLVAGAVSASAARADASLVWVENHNPNARECLPNYCGFELWQMTPDGANARITASASVGRVLEPDWTPDGRRVVYISARYNPASGNDQTGVRVMNPDLSDDRELAPELTGARLSPAWSPGGSLIVFSFTVNELGGESNLFVVRPDGSGLRQLTSLPDNEAQPFFSADGRRVFFTRTPSWGDEPWSVVWWQSIWSVAVDGSGLREHSFGDAFANLGNGAASPSGDRLALSGGGITAASLDGAVVQRVSSDPWAQDPAWSPDGRALTYITHNPDVTRTIWRVPSDPSAGDAIALRHGVKSHSWGPDWISDEPRATAAGSLRDQRAPEVTLAKVVQRSGRDPRTLFVAGTGPKAPRKLRVKDAGELAFVALDRTGLGRVRVVVRRRGPRGQVRTTRRYVIGSKKDWARLKRGLRRGTYELTFKTADVVGNSTRLPALAVRVAP